MALEDFFTITELKNGLTSPERVNDLITAIQKDQDSIVKVNNFGQATRQWSTVASTIAATEDHNCLSLFIDLNGLSFIDKWLNNAQNLKNDAGNTVLEDLIIELLKALERLQIDSQKSFDSGIGKTVQNLVDNGSSLICEKAKMLRDKWMLIRESDAVPRNVENEEIPKLEKSLEKVPTNQEPTRGDTNHLVKFDASNSKTELEEMSSLSNPLEQMVASSADVDNVLESSRKTDVVGDKELKSRNQVESPKTSSSSESDREAENEENGLHLFKRSMNKTSESELDYGMIDPLEVARQVANEVEREVDDSRERSCSTSESPKTPESTIPEETPPVMVPLKEPTKESETTLLVSKPDITASQVSEVAQESEPNTGKGISGFDLNQEVCSEEVDNINPVSVVSAFRATAAAELPTTPLQFEGALGWKGSASTSAFRRVPENEKSGTHSSSKQRLNRLDIDLNLVESSLGPGGVGVPSGEESSVEAGPKRPERPQLDLNSIGDEGGADVARSDWWQSPSRSSSSSSKLPSRNIDLNLTDQPPQESVISIFGTKVEVKNKGFWNLQQPSGRITNPRLDFDIARTTTHYNNQLFYGHNGVPSGPTMFFYGPPGGPTGPIPYMADPRGGLVGPGSSSTHSSLPFMVNMAATGGSTGGGPSGPTLHNFDLNTGLSIVGGKRHEPDARWDFFPVNKHHQPPWR